MTDIANLIQTLAARWNNGLAEKTVQQINSALWSAGGRPSQDLAAAADQLRDLLKLQLTRLASPAEQMRIMETSYRFEQALGNRKEALGLAKNLRHLSERKADALHQVRSASLLADAWYHASALDLAIDWSRRALQTAKPLVIKSQGGRPLKIQFANEEIALAWRMGLQGRADESVDKLLADAIQRCKTLGDAPDEMAALTTWCQVRVLQGRWTDAVAHTHQCLQADPSGSAVGPALWAGARAACRQRDLPTAAAWADQAIQLGRKTSDPSVLVPALLSKASVLFLGGQEDWRSAADEAIALARAWKVEILLRWAMLERSWIHLAANRADVEEMRATADSLAKTGAAPLEAEARYALYHALTAAGADAQTEYDQAQAAFTRLRMTWHLDRAEKRERLLTK